MTHLPPKRTGGCIKRLGRRTMSTIYKDSLIEITDQEVVFHHYYFPFGGDKHVPLSQIEAVQVWRTSFLGGSWRLWGTGDFRTWYAQDNKRSSRDRTFIACLRHHFLRVGFTVEDSKPVMNFFRERGLLNDRQPT